MTFAAETYASVPPARFGALHAHRFLFRVALAIGNIFAWILVFQYFYTQANNVAVALASTVLMYALAQVFTVILTPLSAAHLRRGTKRSIIYGALLAGAAYVFLAATLDGTLGGEPAAWGIGVFAILIGAYRALYWVPYHLRTASASRERMRLPVAYEAAIALMPLFAGITLVTFPFAPQRLLFGAAFIVLMSLVPLVSVRDVAEGFSWNYGETFRHVFAPRHRNLLAVSFMQGIQGAALFLLWPIAILLIVGLNYQTFGGVMSATLFAVLLLHTLYRRFARRTAIEHSPLVHAAFSMSGWLLRFFAGSPFAVFFADSYSYVSMPRRAHSIDVPTFEQAADGGSFVDEYTALKEIGLAIGRIAVCLMFGLLLSGFSLAAAFLLVFLLAALSSAAAILIERSAAPTVY